MRSSPIADRVVRFCLVAVALVGTGIAAYLTYASYADAPIACSTGGCETVQSSTYATLAGIPLSVLGLIGFCAIAVAALGDGPRARTVTAALATIGAVFSVYLIIVQAFLIGAFCQWCLASDLLMCLLLVLAVGRLLMLPADATRVERARAGASP